MPTELSTILKLSVPVIVRIGSRSMPLEGILSVSPGAIIELNKPADAELDLLINNKAIATGQAVKVGENFGLRIEKVGSARQRVEAMGQ